MTLRKSIEDFFDNNRALLEKIYPGIKARRLVQDYEDSLANGDQIQLESYFYQLKKGIPLEYIFHQKYFYNSFFQLDPHCLIPRFETEILVEHAIQLANQRNYKTIIDIGTGPGTILLSLLKELNHSVQAWGTDLCENALEMAKKNEQHLRPQFLSQDHSIHWLKADRFHSSESFDQLKFDLIVSNPPYIKKSDENKISPQVHTFEPHLALYLPDEEYDLWFAQFFEQVQIRLNPGGSFLMEGHEDHLPSLLTIAKKYFIKYKNLELLQDLTLRNRFLLFIKD